MKQKLSLSLIVSLFLAPSLSAQDVLPDGMTAITPTSIEVTAVDDINRCKNNKPVVKLPNGNLIFSATNSTYGDELYIYNGSEVSLIKDIAEGSQGSNPQWMTVVGNKVYFSAYTQQYGEELWVTDGTEAGTQLVKDIYEGSEGSNLFGLTAFNGKLLFFARDIDSDLDPIIDAQTAEEWLWISDGTAEGTERLADTPTKVNIDGVHGYIVPCGNKAFFIGYDRVNNETLWVTDATKTGTKAVTNINPKASSSTNFETEAAIIDWMYNVDDEKIIFRAQTVAEKVGGDYGNEIWYSDGTEAGTNWIGLDYAAGYVDGVPNNTEFAFPIAYKGKVYFRARDARYGVEPGVTDFTAEGTRCFSDINHWNNDPAMDSWGPEFPYVWKDYLFFRANGSYYMPGDPQDYDSGYCLWRYNLAEDGVFPTDANGLVGCEYHKVWTNGFEIYEGNNSDEPNWFTAVGDHLFFRAQDQDANLEVWKLESVDGTPIKVVDMEGNTQPHNFIEVDGSLFFVTSTTKRLYKYFVTEPTGIEEIEKEITGVNVYQNGSELVVEANKQVNSVSLYDITGNLVKVTSGNSTNVEGLKGIYIVKVGLADGNSSIAKTIIR